MAVMEEVRAGFVNGFGEELVRVSDWKVFGDGSAKHVEPVAETGFALFEGSGAVEKKGVRDFEAVTFEERGVFGNAGVIPGARKRL